MNQEAVFLKETQSLFERILQLSASEDHKLQDQIAKSLNSNIGKFNRVIIIT